MCKEGVAPHPHSLTFHTICLTFAPLTHTHTHTFIILAAAVTLWRLTNGPIPLPLLAKAENNDNEKNFRRLMKEYTLQLIVVQKTQIKECICFSLCVVSLKGIIQKCVVAARL